MTLRGLWQRRGRRRFRHDRISALLTARNDDELATVLRAAPIVYRVMPRGVVEIAYVRHCRRSPPA